MYIWQLLRSWKLNNSRNILLLLYIERKSTEIKLYVTMNVK
jgi:hypothetical protein